VFAFDTLVQNPDRRPENPNLWVRSDRIGVLDHEQAFAFLVLAIIGGAPRPWTLATQETAFRFLENHIFYGPLCGASLNLLSFQSKLAGLTDEQLRTYASSVPVAWQSKTNGLCDKIVEYLREARGQAVNLVNFVKHVLR
jgi:hypothetical protein